MFEDEVFVAGYLLELHHIVFVGVVSLAFGNVWVEVFTCIDDVSDGGEIRHLSLRVVGKILYRIQPDVVITRQKTQTS